MAETVKLPSSIKEAEKALNGLGKLLTATEWERAAIVATFVEKGARGGDRSKARTGFARIDATAFARKGITGLKSHMSVLHYLDAWMVTAKRSHPEPGSTVTLPTLEFPKRADSNAGSLRSAKAAIKSGDADPDEVEEVLAAAIEFKSQQRGKKKKNKVNPSKGNENGAALGSLSQAHTMLQHANATVDPDALTAHEAANAEVMLRGCEAEIEIWRENASGGLSDEAIEAAMREVS